MKNNAQVFLSAYMITAMVHLFCLAAQKEQAETISKILLMPFLIGYVIVSAGNTIKPALFLLIALLFSWAGDIILLNSGEDVYFMFGLASFLCAQIAYIFTFKKFSLKNTQRISGFYFVPFIIYATALFILVYPKLDTMLLPVALYTIIITLMGIAALARKGKTTSYSFQFVLIGAISFIVSDSLIAINKFYNSFNAASICIMLTYIVAQYLIATGCVLHLWQSKEN
ncbi:MAG: lysoplasmalogenase [Fimbriimonadaceae bacterium]|nr:lysoplasmalogenase [Chitinophagales bacterium]